MDSFLWLRAHGIDLIQTAAIVVGFFSVRAALRSDAKSRQIASSIRLSEHHRTLWERLLLDPDLGRILAWKPDLKKKAITPAEEMFVIFILIHLSDTFFAMKAGFYERPRGLEKDVRELLSLPIPRAIWERSRELHEIEFVDFVEGCLRSE